jgi:hypothetical protein
MEKSIPVPVFTYTHNDDAPRGHKEVISLHLFGRSRTEIARTVGLSEDQVGRILVHPPNAEYIRAKMNSLLVATSNAAVDFVGLVAKAVDAVKIRLEDNNSPREQLAAAKMVLDLVKFGDPEGQAANLGRQRGTKDDSGGVSELKADVRAGEVLEQAERDRVLVTNDAVSGSGVVDRFAFLRGGDEGVEKMSVLGDNPAVPLAGTSPAWGGSGEIAQPARPTHLGENEDEEGLGF